MNDVSKHLHDFVKELATSTLSTSINMRSAPLLSNKSVGFLKKIYQQLTQAEHTWTNQRESILATLTLDNYSMKENASYSLIPPEIKTQIETHPYVIYNYQFKVGQRTVAASILIPTPVGDTPPPAILKRKINTMIYRIFLWLSIATKHATNGCTNHMRLFFYMSDHLKITPQQQKAPVNWINANTAFTTLCSPTTDITLFREEEWFKVFIHETFHNLGLDFSRYDRETTAADAAVLQHYTVKIADLRLYETYCEMWAEILNTMFIAHATTRIKGDFDTVYRKMDKLLRAERIWSMFQCVKVLHHHQIVYSHILRHPIIHHNTNTGGSDAPSSSYTEKTNAFCYYVLKQGKKQR